MNRMGHGEGQPCSTPLVDRRGQYTCARLTPTSNKPNDSASEAEPSSGRRTRGFLDAFALAGDDLSTTMQKVFWKNPKTAWRYMQLAQVVSPGSSGCAMIPGVTEEQYRLINEFPLSNQRRSWRAFGNER